MDRTRAIDHVTLTVSNLDRTKSFYEQLFQTKLEKHKENSFNLLPVGIPVWFVQWEKQYPRDMFDERRIGLDHIAFHLDTLEELEKFVNRLQEMGVKTVGLERFAGKYPYVAFRDPDNIQTEFFIPEEFMITRDQAQEILHSHVKNQNLRRHCLAVGAVMKVLAQKLGGDPDEWEVLGLIHDSDWEETKDQPDQHTKVTLQRLQDLGYTGSLIHALQSHNTKLTHLADLEGPMEWALETCDELTGFIVACTLVSPTKKIADLAVESVIKKFPKKEFARAVDRNQIAQCEEKLGIKLEEFVQIALSAMQSIASEIGL